MRPADRFSAVRNAPALLPRRAGYKAPSLLHSFDPPEAFILRLRSMLTVALLRPPLELCQIRHSRRLLHPMPQLFQYPLYFLKCRCLAALIFRHDLKLQKRSEPFHLIKRASPFFSRPWASPGRILPPQKSFRRFLHPRLSSHTPVGTSRPNPSFFL